MTTRTDISAIRQEPIEPTATERESQWHFKRMAVGDVFYVQRKNGKQQSGQTYSARRYWESKLPGWKFTIKAVSVGLKVQRTE